MSGKTICAPIDDTTLCRGGRRGVCRLVFPCLHSASKKDRDFQHDAPNKHQERHPSKYRAANCDREVLRRQGNYKAEAKSGQADTDRADNCNGGQQAIGMAELEKVVAEGSGKADKSRHDYNDNHLYQSHCEPQVQYNTLEYDNISQ